MRALKVTAIALAAALAIGPAIPASNDMGYLANGPVPTGGGSCAINTQLGGNTIGSFKANGACAGGTIGLTFSVTAPNGWACTIWDLTTTTDTIKQTSYTQTTASFAAIMASADLAVFMCFGF
jgi:hypothetical protein